MTSRSQAKPRTLAEILEEVYRAFDNAKHPRRPLPLPKPDAPTPPPSHHDQEDRTDE